MSKTRPPLPNQFDAKTLFTILKNSINRRENEQLLENLETANGFMTVLYEIITSNAEEQVRVLASIIFKNTISKYWKPNCDYELSQQEKHHLMSNMLNFVKEQNPKIFIHLSLALSKVTRGEPQLALSILSEIIKIIQANDQFAYNGLKMIKHIIKELSSKKIQNDKQFFCQVATNLLPFISQRWSNSMNDLKTCKTTTKILMELCVNGFNPNIQKECFLFLNVLLNKIQSLQNSVEKSPDNKILFRLLITWIQVPLKFHFSHGLGDLLVPWLTYAMKVILTSTTESYFLIKCISFLSNLIEKDSQKVEHMMNQNAYVSLIKQLLQFMKLTDSELDLWKSDPEEFYLELENTDDHTLRGCAETCLVLLLEYIEPSRDVFTSLSQVILKETSKSLDKNSLLMREACYSAIGWCCYSLYDKIVFEDWFDRDLKEEFIVKDVKYNLIKRRVGWLFGRWIEQMFSHTTRYGAYGLISTHLVYSSDVVLCLTGMQALEGMLDEQDFDQKYFLEFLEPVLKKIADLLSSLSDDECKLKVLNLCGSIISKMPQGILKWVSPLVQLFGGVFSKSNSMVKGSIVQCVSKMVTVLGKDSQKIWNFLLPLLDYALDSTKPEQILMVEDSLALYQTILENMVTMNSEWLKLYNHLLVLLGKDHTEYLINVLKITEQYVLIAKRDFFNAYGEKLNQILTIFVEQVKPKAILLMVNVVEHFLVMYPKDAIIVFQSTFVKFLQELSQNPERLLASTLLSAIFSRILYHEPKAMLKFFSNQQSFCTFLDMWLSHIDDMTTCFKRKQSAISLLSLYPTNESTLWERFPLVVNLGVAVLYEEDEVKELIQMTVESELAHKHSISQDGMLFIDIHKLLQEKFSQIKNQLGQEKYQMLISKVDPQVLKQLTDYKPTNQK